MRISLAARQKIQLVLAAAILIAAARSGYILYERHITKLEERKKRSAGLNPDYYVVPKKLYPYDLKSARELIKQPVWVKEGYRYTYYPFNPATRRTTFAHEAGLLLPIQKLEIKDVVTDKAPNSGGQKAIVAVFETEGKTNAVQIGL